MLKRTSFKRTVGSAACPFTSSSSSNHSFHFGRVALLLLQLISIVHWIELEPPFEFFLVVVQIVVVFNQSKLTFKSPPRNLIVQLLPWLSSFFDSTRLSTVRSGPVWVISACILFFQTLTLTSFAGSNRKKADICLKVKLRRKNKWCSKTPFTIAATATAAAASALVQFTESIGTLRTLNS